MKKLVFRKLWILSKIEKSGISLSLSPSINLLLGENDVGKSTLIKSLYHCLGADTPQINNRTWKQAHPIYCVEFELAGEKYHVVRDEKHFGVFDGNKKLISRHTGVGGQDGIAQFMNKLLGFNIELERQADQKLGNAGPAFYFLPFYIDQDEGWLTSWSSFAGLKQFSNYRQLMIDYHLGVRSQNYYDAKKREIELKERLTEIESERTPMQAVRDSFEKRKIHAQVDLDPAVLRAEMETIVDQYNAIYSKQQDALSHLKDVKNQRNEIDKEIALLRKAISEINADYVYAASPETPDVVGCPHCGTEFHNSFVEQFGILDDIDHCQAVVDWWLKKRSRLTVQLEKAESDYKEVSSQASKIKANLDRNKESVTLSELIASEGMKEMISILNKDIKEFLRREDVINRDIIQNSEGLKVDSHKKKEILIWYKSRMKEFLNELNVGVLSEDDYKSLDKQIKNNALGSDLPRALLAQYFAFLSVMKKFNSFVICPMLVDSPFQQEQDYRNREAIFRFITSKRIENQQLIIATVSIGEFMGDSRLRDATLHELDNTPRVLKGEQFQSVLDDIGAMHAETLAP